MVIEEIDFYNIQKEDLVEYLSQCDVLSCGAKTWTEFARKILDKKLKSVDFGKIEKKIAEVIDGVPGAMDIRLL